MDFARCTSSGKRLCFSTCHRLLLLDRVSPAGGPRLGGRTRGRLLEAAEHVFGELGFYDASIVKITEEAGVAQGTFYLYFASKKDIFDELVRDLNGLDPAGLELLTQAGYPDGLPIKVLYTDEQEGRTLAALLQQMLGDSGFDVELVFAQLVGVLEGAGLERIDADGAPFDPNEHEAVMHEDGDGEPTVAATMRTGRSSRTQRTTSSVESMMLTPLP